MKKEFAFILYTLCSFFLLSGVSISQELEYITNNGYEVYYSGKDSYIFQKRCDYNDEFYNFVIVNFQDDDEKEYNLFSVIFNTELRTMTASEIKKLLNDLDENAPTGMVFTHFEEQNRIALNYIIFENIFPFIEERSVQRQIVNIFDRLITFACLTDSYIKQLIKESSKPRKFGITEGQEESKSDALKELEKISKKFQITLPEVAIPKK